MFRKDYYCLIAGLREYSLDAEKKGFDAPAIRSDVSDKNVAEQDRKGAPADTIFAGRALPRYPR